MVLPLVRMLLTVSDRSLDLGSGVRADNPIGLLVVVALEALDCCFDRTTERLAYILVREVAIPILVAQEM
jgi:hypothetical protein